MEPMLAGAEPLLMDEELVWCRANQQVPEADAVLKLHRIFLLEPDAPALGRAVEALRRIKPRPPATVRRLYAFIHADPQTGTEELLAQGIFPLIGTDLESTRFLKPRVDEVRREEGPRSVNLVRFDYDRTIDDADIQSLAPINADGRIIAEMFAFVGPSPFPKAAKGDELIAAALLPAGPSLLLSAKIESVKNMTYFVARMRISGQPMELRRFLRAERLPDPWGDPSVMN